MDTYIRLIGALLLLAGIIYLFLSVSVLNAYEVKTEKKPQSFQFWSFNSEMKELFPVQAKTARYLEIVLSVLGLAWLIMFIINS